MSNRPYSTEPSRWNAVQARDSAADGHFVYAVRTTKIYCRPVCKARRARRANVAFYTHSLDAERAGFRACKRCKPEMRGGMPEEAAVRRVRSLIDENLWKLMTEPNGLDSEKTDELAQKAGVSKWHFHRLFKEMMGTTPAEYTNQQRAFKSDVSMRREEIWLGSFDTPVTPNTTDVAGTQYQDLCLPDIDWDAINEDLSSGNAIPS